MTPPATALIRLDAVAINAPDLALGYFSFYGLLKSSSTSRSSPQPVQIFFI
jgi:hypothetical protein